jgi:hypothetical protein
VRCAGEGAVVAGIVTTWPDEPNQASPDPAVLAETLRRAAGGGQRRPGRSHPGAETRHPGRADAEAAGEAGK